MSRCEFDISEDVKLIAIDDSDKKLDESNADIKINFPVSEGLSPFMYPDKTKYTALDVYDEIKKALMQ